MSICALCQVRGNPRKNKDIKCGFPNGDFWIGNWNCATLNEIRDLVESAGTKEWQEDQNYAHLVLPVDFEWSALWVSWHKNRGRTESVVLLLENGPPKVPTEADLLEVLSCFGVP